MNGDIFGNLREWGHIPEQLTELAQSGSLNDHQKGLTRLLRYRHNWRLRELALESVKHLRSPTDELLVAVLGILADNRLYYQVRMLAASVLGEWLRSSDGSAPQRFEIARGIEERLTRIRELPEPPVLHEAVHCALVATQETPALKSM